jgi:hypothetical protein
MAALQLANRLLKSLGGVGAIIGNKVVACNADVQAPRARPVSSFEAM